MCLRYLPVVLVLASAQAVTAELRFDGGHLKGRLHWTDSAENPLPQSSAFDQGADLRLRWRADGQAWNAELDYQLQGHNGGRFPGRVGEPLPGAPRPGEGRRLLKLDATLAEGRNYRSLQRLDRLSLGYTGERWVGRVGRQAVSWGNGLVYNPMDIFNPFEPTAVDKEYKPGDDMLYGQYLRHNGDDLQAVWVVRRDRQRNLDRDVNSLALKYHGFAGAAEYDLLLARHYRDWMLAAGGSTALGGALLRADVTATDSEGDTVISLVTSLAWSWVGLDRNMSALVEYYHNGFGLRDGFELADIQARPELSERLGRGELFTLGRHYLAASLLVEISPLWQLSPNLFINLADRSRFAQLVSTHDLHQDWRLLLAVQAPVGGNGTEYGGIATGVEGLELRQGLSCFGQLAFYF